MTMANALYYNPQSLDKFIGHDSNSEHPLALQIGGYDPEITGEAAYLASQFAQYHSINLNCGCPSNRARRAGFGAELMMEPEHTRKVVHAMTRRVTGTEITVKCRIGVLPDRPLFEHLVEFIEACRVGGVRKFILHSRNVVLRGLSPAQNRTIPPLQYDVVVQLAQHFKECSFVINGGIATFDQVDELLARDGGLLKGAMIGREAYRNPFLFQTADTRYYGVDTSVASKSRREILEEYLEYCDRAQLEDTRKIWGTNTCNLIKPLHNFFVGCPAERLYKAQLDAVLLRCKDRTVAEVVTEAIGDQEVLNDYLDR